MASSVSARLSSSLASRAVSCRDRLASSSWRLAAALASAWAWAWALRSAASRAFFWAGVSGFLAGSGAGAGAGFCSTTAGEVGAGSAGAGVGSWKMPSRVLSGWGGGDTGPGAMAPETDPGIGPGMDPDGRVSVWGLGAGTGAGAGAWADWAGGAASTGAAGLDMSRQAARPPTTAMARATAPRKSILSLRVRAMVCPFRGAPSAGDRCIIAGGKTTRAGLSLGSR